MGTLSGFNFETAWELNVQHTFCVIYLAFLSGMIMIVIDLMMKSMGRIIFKTMFRCPHDTIIRSKYNI